ncbi:MAG TPA: fumarylacetoacetate hydrolase family protein [Solirubrobacteraceae bacterium]|jgi:2-keto-4-pentenoate hydratase/2-oxohepta-3-ene-1,7-dioic acid hydratase in catechol pathway
MPSPSGRPFALGTFINQAGAKFAAIVLGDGVFPLSPSRSIRELLERWDEDFDDLQRQADRCRDDKAPFTLGDLRPLAPVAPPGQIFQAGANYRQHVLELLAGAERRHDSSDGVSDERRAEARRALDERARTGAPFVFQGSANAVIGARDEIVLPPDSEQADWELELVAVIGRRTRRVDRREAMESVAGYMIANDLTLRDRLSRPDVPGGIDWLAAKNPPTFLPLGPLLVPAAHVSDPTNLRMELSVNGRTMQDATTADMLFDVAALIEYLSTITQLVPGDLVLTGSPAGNGAHHGVFLQPGDEVVGRIEGLGEQRNRCRAESVVGYPAAVAGAEVIGG